MKRILALAYRSSVYPLLWSLIPVLIFYSNNIDQVPTNVIWRPLIVSLSLAAALFGGLLRLLKDQGRAANITTLGVVLFFLYGHFYNLLENRSLFGLIIGRHRFLLPLWGTAGGLLLYLLIRWRKVSPEWRGMMNILAILLAGWNVIQISAHILQGSRLQKEIKEAALVESASDPGLRISAGYSPDVYYIILDGYAREDVLRDDYDLDNSPFLQDLKDMGFVVPDCAQSNYAWTPLSLSSTFQMNYVQGFSNIQQSGNEHIDYRVFQEYIAHNPTRENFRSLGYKFIAFETGWPFTEITDADLYIQRRENPLEQFSGRDGLTAFEAALGRTTVLRSLMEMRTAWLKNLPVTILPAEEQHFERLKFVMAEVEKLPNIFPGRKFVFLHLVAPHAPYVFDENGNFSDIGAEEIGYPTSVRYLNKWFLSFSKELIANSSVSPIIILQGDHGWYKGNRLAILNAYYLPGGGDKEVYDQISPVNSFRILFNYYFGGKYSLLEDKSYNSSSETQMDLTAAPPTCEKEP